MTQKTELTRSRRLKVAVSTALFFAAVFLSVNAIGEVQDLEVAHYEQIANDCTATDDPLKCMSKNGRV